MVEAEPVLPGDEEASDGSGGAAGEVEVDSSSSSMTYSDDSSDELSFTGGCDDPQEFVRQVRKKTANKKSGTPLGLLGELIVRMDDQEEVEVLLGWKEARVIAAAAGRLYLDDSGATAIPPRPQCTLAEVQAVFVDRFPLTGAAKKADDTLKETVQNSSIRKHRPRFNRILVKAGLVNSILDADIILVVDRRVKKALIETCSESIPSAVKKKHPSTASLRSYLLGNLRLYLNLLLLKTAAETYSENVLQPLAVDVKIKNGAYWKQKESKKSRKRRDSEREERKKAVRVRVILMVRARMRWHGSMRKPRTRP
jgi:hypothetical protein